MSNIAKNNDSYRNRNQRVLSQQLMETGKLPPQAVDLEEAVLSALLSDKEAIHRVIETLTPESFYKEEHHWIYFAILELFSNKQPIDILTVIDKLKSLGKLELVGGAYYISVLAGKVSAADNIEYHAAIVKQKAVGRDIIRIGQEAIRAAYEDITDVFDCVNNLEKGLNQVSSGLIKKRERHISDIVTDVIAEQRKPSKVGLTGITSGLHLLDGITGGWQNTDFIILAARPAMGKSGLATVFATAAAETGVPVLFYSCEMGEMQVATRIMSQKTGTPIKKIRLNKLEEYEKDRLEYGSLPISQLPIYIDDSTELSIRDFRSKSIKLKREKGIRLIIIDYLQLMTDGGKSKNNREQEVANISKAIKNLAKELNIPIIALSQISRDVEKKDKKHPRPMLSSLRESGSLEQESDMVIFLFREEYYDKTAVNDAGESMKGVAEIIIAKHRNGETDTVNVKFTNYTTNFSNLHDPVEEMTDAPF